MKSPKSQRFSSHRLDRSLSAFAGEWDAHNARITGGHPMLDSRFVECLLRHFGRGDEFLVRGNNAAGQPQLMSILRRDRPGVWSSFLPSQTQIAPHLADAEADPFGLFRALPGYAGQINLLCQDPWFSPTRESIALPCKSQHHALTMGIELRGSFEEYWHSRSKNLVANLRRYRARIERSGMDSRMVSIVEKDQMPEAIRRYGQLECSGWKGQHGTAVAADNPQGAFYQELLESFANNGQATIFEFWIGERLAASRLTIHSGEMLIILKTAFDERLSEFAPGRILLQEVIRAAFRLLPQGRIEFYTNASSDQLAWATDRRHIDHHTIYGNQAFELLAQVRGMLQRTMRHPEAASDSGDPSPIAQVTRYERPEQIPATFDALFAAAEERSFDCGRDWFANFVATVIDPDGDPTFLAAEADGHSLAILPLRLGKTGFGALNAASLSNYYTSLYAPLLAEGAGEREIALLLADLKAHYPKLSQLRFAPMDSQAPSSAALRQGLQLSGYCTFSYFCFGNWYLPVTGSWDETRSGFKGSVRSTVRRMGKKFTAEAGRLEIITEPGDLETAIGEFQQVYAASWKVPEPHPGFMPGFIRMLAQSGQLRLGIAWLDGRAIAAQIWVVHGRKASIYKLAHNERHTEFSPGTLLTAYLMEHVIERDGVLEVDYLIGDDAYKQSWMTHRRERWGIVAYNPRTITGLVGLLAECARRVAKRLGFGGNRTQQ